ncbi:MAG: hypothetical protein K8R60_19905 [Burkholderiales bacterium]|nr:hypothetical protein [Burkholderiales bacterium]
MPPVTQASRQTDAATRAPKREVPRTLHTTTLTALLQDGGNGYSREYLRENVLAWGARKWPDLFEGRNEYADDDLETRLGASQVQVVSARDGGFAWSFRGIRPDLSASRLWETRVLFLGHGDQDLLFVSTGFLGQADARLLIAQPGFLCGLIDHLPFDDGGYRVCTAPRQVLNEAAFASFREHLLSPRRTMPVLALGSSPASSESRDWENCGHIDARAIARKVGGLAHVVSLGPLVLDRLESWLGSDLAVKVGDARLFMPGLDDEAPEPAQHPVFSPARAGLAGEPAGDVGSAAEAAIHAWSISASRRLDFEALWLVHARASRP